MTIHQRGRIVAASTAVTSAWMPAWMARPTRRRFNCTSSYGCRMKSAIRCASNRESQGDSLASPRSQAFPSATRLGGRKFLPGMGGAGRPSPPQVGVGLVDPVLPGRAEEVHLHGVLEKLCAVRHVSGNE